VGGKFWINHLTKSYVVSHEQEKASANLSWSSSSSKEQSLGWENHQTRDHQVSHCTLGGGAMKRGAQQMLAVLHWFHQVIFQIADLRTKGSHTSHLCTTVSKKGSHTYIVTFTSNINPVLLRYFYLLFIFCVLSFLNLHSQGLFKIYFNYIFFLLDGFDSGFWVSKAGRHLQSRCSINWAIPPEHFSGVILEVESCELFVWGWLQTNIFLISSSYLAIITGVSLWHLVYKYFWERLLIGTLAGLEISIFLFLSP
jgi:hypothetical protein